MRRVVATLWLRDVGFASAATGKRLLYGIFRGPLTCP
jgi:hypothetical protein